MAPDRPRSKLVVLGNENLDAHHLCCALGDRKHEEGVRRKKQWLRKRFEEGLVFRKLDERGKVFIEYAPSEVAWRPIMPPGWMTIHCLWVSGKFAKRGYGRTLIEGCVEDARDKGWAGVVAATGKTKRPFLLDPKFLTHMGFEAVETVGEFRPERIRSRAKAQRVASPLGTFGLERDGGVVTHHLNTDNAVRRMLSKIGAA